MQLIGVSTDEAARPSGKWTKCHISGNEYDFYPVISVADLRRQMRIPLSLRFTLKLMGNNVWKGSDILQFHRLEPALLFYKKRVHRVTIIHQNMKVLNDRSADIRWKYMPGAYSKLEDIVLPAFDEIRIVRQDAVRDYQARFPSRRDHIEFLPTWMNPDLFYVPDDNEKSAVRNELLSEYGWPSDSILIASVGRLDYQKNPSLALNALKHLVGKYPSLKFIMIGDGVLRNEVKSQIASLGLQNTVALLGVKPQEQVARLLRSVNLMVLSSAYEGMPRCVIEALGCGIPVASTDVGEVRLILMPGINGSIAEDHTADSLSRSVEECIKNLNIYSGNPCISAVEKYSAGVVLHDLYNCYRRLASEGPGENS